MLASSTPIAFVATSDAAASQRFYRDVLGLELLGDEPFALVFRLHGSVLRVQKVERVAPQPYTVLGWQVRGLDDLLDRLTTKGLRCERYPGLEQDERGAWRAPSGARVAWFKDPDGNVLSLTEW
jgi:catechol 2,3-dioxygenase-like lactoylglutathione lyase family enzyme